jgi:hypothetical protein
VKTGPIWDATLGGRIRESMHRRRCGLVPWMLYCGAAIAFIFLWNPLIHNSHQWATNGDIWTTFQVAGRVAHGHVGTIYLSYPDHFVTFPAIVYLLAPVALLASGLNMSVDTFTPDHVVAQPEAWIVLALCVLAISAIPLLACDALADRIGVSTRRRFVLGLGEAVALWGATMVWGHPEDAVALGLSLFALLFSIDGRWNGAAWLFGLAVAFQPLALVTFPLFLVVVTARRWLRWTARAATPTVAVLLGPLVANFHQTAKTLLQQPGFPNSAARPTPWTALAPHLGSAPGVGLTVAAGPGRVVLVVVACAVAWWARRWRDQPEMLVWTFALLLALRPLTESVILPYYLYPGLAVGLLAASRSESWRFGLAVVVSVVVAVISERHWAWLPWWITNLSGLLVVVACGARLPGLHREAVVHGARPLPRAPKSNVEARHYAARGRGAARRKQTKRKTTAKR